MTISSLGDSLKQKIQSASPFGKQVEAALVIEKAALVFQEEFGDAHQYIRPLYIKNRTLTVSCETSVFIQEIRLKQAEIIQKINSHFAFPPIDRIRYLT